MYTYGISFQLCFVPPWFLLQSWTAGIPPGVLHGHSFGQHFVVLFCLLHAARVSGSGSDAIKDQWDLSAQYLGCWEHPCILTSIFAKENRTWICTVFVISSLYTVNWPNDSTIFAPSRSWDNSATTLFVGCNLSYPYTLWIPTYFPRMVAQQPWALITIVE